MTTSPIRLGQLLVSLGQVSQADVDRALNWQRDHAERLGTILVRMGALSDEGLYAALARQTGLALLAPDFRPTAGELQDALKLLPWSLPWWGRQAALPWLDEDGRLLIAAVDPWASDLREALDSTAQSVAEWSYVLPSALERWQLLATEAQQSGGDADARTLRELAEDAPVISFVNGILAQAVESRASDVHIEPGEREFTVRMRVDGVLHTRQTQAMTRFSAVASRIKLVAGLDIAERRLPQDGRTTIRVAGTEIDIRVSAIPAVHGESLVMRLLPKQRSDLALERLGMENDHLAAFRRWLGWPNGLILVTGPTGSGKSTTLYGALSAVNDFSRKIVTVEDPVELRLPHIVQIQTQADIGYTFSRALRSILRHDPDIIMIGEIRDKETAEIAIQAALTGHLVLATLHTNDALSAVTRLVDMGVEPYLVSAALKAVMAQRLVRVLCNHCAAPLSPDQVEQMLVDTKIGARQAPDAGLAARYRRPVGCEQCQHTGFRGRHGIYELVELSTELQHMVATEAPQAELIALADRQGRRSLLGDGILKVHRGMTTFDEVLRASGGSLDAE